MIVSIVVATGKNGEIGRQNKLLCHLPADLKRFKERTQGHVVLMGRKTFESLPKGALPNRTNAVLSRTPGLVCANCLVFSSLDEALIRFCNHPEVFVIGGAQVYEQALPLANKLYLTKISATFEDADAFFPAVDWSEWRRVGMETFVADDKNAFSFTIYAYERI